MENLRVLGDFSASIYRTESLSGPPGFTFLVSFAPCIQFYLLLSPYLCFISFLYPDLYVLGDDALIS